MFQPAFPRAFFVHAFCSVNNCCVRNFSGCCFNLQLSKFRVNLSSVVFAEVKIHQSPSIQTHRSVAVSNRERVSNQQFKREDERSKQSISGSCQPQTPSTHQSSHSASLAAQSSRASGEQRCRGAANLTPYPLRPLLVSTCWPRTKWKEEMEGTKFVGL